jgi:arylsulfatase A-like enzyme
MAATESNSRQGGVSEPPIGLGGSECARGSRSNSLCILLLAAAFGLAVGLLELLGLVIRVKLIERGFFLRSRHFVWMVPLSDLAIFGGVGLALAVLWWAIPYLTTRGAVRILLFLGCMSLLLLVRGLNSLAAAMLAAGVALRAAPWVEARLERSWRRVRWAAGALAVVVAVLAGQAISREMSEHYRAKTRPPLRVDQVPNVLLIVLDTVRADRLSLYGYGRETTPNLARLAPAGVRFERARASAPWTLPSHASLFTARWPHELDVERKGRLDTTHTTLAEFLRERGYATAGFVANQFYCGRESGLARGFDSYADFPINGPEIFRASSLGWLLSRVAARIWGEVCWWCTGDAASTIVLDFARKDAGALNREFLDWLATHDGRPFFAFLNYFDAHDPYLVPRGAPSRFAAGPKSRGDFAMLRDWQKSNKQELTEREIQLARDSYDDCIAALDHDLGRLIAELEARGVLERTLLIITADHGEQFGEHGDFGHGYSVYEPEVRVPLVMICPGLIPRGQVAEAAASLRDVPATVIELLGWNGDARLPGRSLAAAWRQPPDANSGSSAITLSELAAPLEVLPGRPKFDGPIHAVVCEGNVYIRHGSGAEELYDLDADPAESQNLSGKPAAGPVLERCRELLGQLVPTAARPAATAQIEQPRLFCP